MGSPSRARVQAQDEAEGRPNKEVYDAEQDKLRAEIDVLQAKVVRGRCSLCSRALEWGLIPL